MNLTIPIRAQSSTSSWSRGMRGNYSMNNSKATRTRYLFSITTALLLVSTLVVGSIGGLLQGASAKSNYNRSDYYTTTTNRNGNNSSNQSTTKTTTPSTTKTTTPAKTTATPAKQVATPTPAATAPTPAATTPAPTPAPVVQKATPQIVAPAAPAPVDTTPAISTMTAAQADKAIQPIAYSSNKLPDDTRNRIFILAGVAAVTGALLYTISFIGATAPAMKREIPIRYIVPVREGVSI